jgi:hypothetical protein
MSLRVTLVLPSETHGPQAVAASVVRNQPLDSDRSMFHQRLGRWALLDSREPTTLKTGF